MEIIFQKDKYNNIIPRFKHNLEKTDIKNFIASLKKTQNQNYNFINILIQIIQKSPEIGQILLDIHYIYKIDRIIECLIEKYIYEKDENNQLKELFIFISKSFQIGKHIYDYIYRIIEKLIQLNSFNNKNKINIFERCINLLIIFYEKYNDNQIINVDNFFFFNNNHIKTNINSLDYNKINIVMSLYINKFYGNNKSIIAKIKFSY